jgi:hypothetical protein
MNHQQAKERLCNGLTRAAKLCDKATDTRAVLHNGLSWSMPAWRNLVNTDTSPALDEDW